MSSSRPTVEDVVWNEQTGQWEFKFITRDLSDFPADDEKLKRVQGEVDFPVEKPVKTKNRSRFSGRKILQSVEDIAMASLVAAFIMMIASIIGWAVVTTYQEYAVPGLVIMWVGATLLAVLLDKLNRR